MKLERDFSVSLGIPQPIFDGVERSTGWKKLARRPTEIESLIKSIHFQCFLAQKTPRHAHSARLPSALFGQTLLTNEEKISIQILCENRKAMDDRIIFLPAESPVESGWGKMCSSLFSVIKNLVWISLKIICLEITNFASAFCLSLLLKLFEAIHD
jgi:hypothetical protein